MQVRAPEIADCQAQIGLARIIRPVLGSPLPKPFENQDFDVIRGGVLRVNGKRAAGQQGKQNEAS